MSLSAEITNMTCADAAAAALLLENNQPGTDSVAVTGYVTNTDGKLSRGQQVFWLDDQKGTTKTFEGYWCNIPGADGSNGEPLNIGDKVIIKGFLMRYNTTPEMKNGDVVIIERAVVNIDTIEASVCEAIEEGRSLNDQENTQDVFVVDGLVEQVVKTDETYFQSTFWMVCNDTAKLQAYNVNMADNVMPVMGDSVRVTGRIKNFGGTIEMVGKAEITKKGDVKIDTIKVNVAQAVTIGKALEKGSSSAAVYVVEGYNDSIAFEFSEQNKNMSFYMCDDLANPTYEFEAYKASTATAIAKGDKVFVMGNLYHYYKAATETTDEIDLVEISNGKASFTDPTLSALENISMPENKAVKVFIDGQIYIINDGKRYNILGAQVM